MSSSDPSQPHDPEAGLPWYKYFWAWFILAPLFVVVIVSSYNISLAVGGADDRVVDNYYKEGRLINVRMDEDVLAASLELTANVLFDRDVSELIIHLQSNTNDFPESLTLDLRHVSNQDLDHVVDLTHIAQGQYQAELQQALKYRWYLRLHPTNLTGGVKRESTRLTDVDPFALELPSHYQWRLRGDIDFATTSSVKLAPVL